MARVVVVIADNLDAMAGSKAGQRVGLDGCHRDTAGDGRGTAAGEVIEPRSASVVVKKARVCGGPSWDWSGQ